ncbi:MAG: hypothetical protein KAT25_11385 [Sulfuriflexus sp.]|nr:hypothetical protein [Sulfuriflexus sp.]
MNYFLTPPCKYTRWFEGIFVCIAGLACFLSYYLIRFDLCTSADCNTLQITRFWASFSELYLVYGVAVLIVGIVLIIDTQMNRLYRLGLETSVLIGVVLSGMVVFAISNEIGNAL